MKGPERTRSRPNGRFMSLRTKFVVFVSLIIIAVCSVLSWYFIQQQAQSMRRALTEMGALLAKSLAHNSRYAAIVEDKTALEQFIDGAMADDEVVYVVITAPDHRPLARKSKGRLVSAIDLARDMESEVYPDPSFARARLSATSGDPFITQYSFTGGAAEETIFDVSVPIMRRAPRSSPPLLPFSLESGETLRADEDSRRPEARVLSVVQIGLTTAKVQADIEAIVRKALILTLTIILFGIGATGLLANRIINPLKRLAVVAKRVAEGDLDATAAPASSDEVGQLADSFNRMTRSVKERNESISLHLQTITRQVGQLTTLNQAGSVISSMIDVEKLVNSVLPLLAEHVGYRRILLMLYDPERGMAHSPRIIGVPQEIEQAVRRIEIPVQDDGSFHADMLLHGRSLLVRDMDQAATRVYPRLYQLARQVGVTCFVAVPLKSPQRIVGFIAADRGEAPCTQADEELLVTLGSQMGVAIDNAEGYRALEQLTQTLERRVEERTGQLVTANEKLQELDRLKSAFVSIVSHELRTPMTSIKGYVENMLDGLTGGLNDKQSYYLSRVKFNVERLTRMINDLLDLSRIEAGRVELVLTPVPVAGLLTELAESLQPLAQAKGVALTSRFEGELVDMQADRDKLHQILTNLIQNAVKFTPKSGEVRLEARERADGMVQFCVADTGSGIAPHEVPKIFERFYRGETVQADQRGAGLGLAITKSLVELHSGQIWVESTAGEGSRFFFTIPLSQPERSSD